MQKLLQQLPASAANLVKSQHGKKGEEAKSPVLVADGPQQTWYSALEGDEMRLLKAPDQEAAAPQDGGVDSSVAQPLRHDDLKEMLDSNKDSLKLEAMKRIVAMIARGKNASDLFPAVVKNVACKNIEVKKLVYVYLVRYAEEQQDLALLSISTFQRGLKDPNQLIRASALRVLSSIRVPIIVPIMMLAIKEAASDMSPYVRKTAAHAIPKLYSLDSDQKDQLIEVIEKLLADKTTLVAGSVVMAFEEVCPERIDLIHKNYRKLCNLLIDVEEWGQVVIINMLTRYARTQFLSPTQNESLLEENAEKAFYGSEEEDSKDNKTEPASLVKRKPYVMDPDHRLLLRNTKPLLQSRNAAVVMSVAQLYFHLAPKAEVGVIAKALVRLLRSHSEVQYVVLQNVATMSIKRRVSICFLFFVGEGKDSVCLDFCSPFFSSAGTQSSIFSMQPPLLAANLKADKIGLVSPSMSGPLTATQHCIIELEDLKMAERHQEQLPDLGKKDNPRLILGYLFPLGELISPVFGAVKTYELLHRMTGEGLSVEYHFSRQPFTADLRMVAVQIQISNNTATEVKNICINEPKLLSGMRVQEFKEIESLPPGETINVVMGIDFCDSTQAASFQLCTHTRQFYVSIQPPVGELMAPVFMSENEFKKEQGKLTGMSEITEKLTLPEKCQSDHVLVQQVTAAANVSRVPCGSDKEYRFAAKTVSSGSLILITLEKKAGNAAHLTINSEKMLIGTMLVKDIIHSLTQ
ncbi:AP-3 complex subunit beta-2-like [Sphaerodactylus townsendi]|uniref:AP-3 complex subunit beta-2-like n=1 Tax=Sphaerodactylus townsendi TaxID=933632 RepID=UPI002025DBEF|nr:AP-3 complex subunit beta-2-like [Sphaerodactylus townsendi]